MHSVKEPKPSDPIRDESTSTTRASSKIVLVDPIDLDSSISDISIPRASRSSNIHSISDDVLLEIFTFFVPFRDCVRSIQLVCRHWNSVVAKPYFWKMKLLKRICYDPAVARDTEFCNFKTKFLVHYHRLNMIKKEVLGLSFPKNVRRLFELTHLHRYFVHVDLVFDSIKSQWFDLRRFEFAMEFICMEFRKYGLLDLKTRLLHSVLVEEDFPRIVKNVHVFLGILQLFQYNVKRENGSRREMVRFVNLFLQHKIRTIDYKQFYRTLAKVNEFPSQFRTVLEFGIQNFQQFVKDISDFAYMAKYTNFPKMFKALERTNYSMICDSDTFLEFYFKFPQFKDNWDTFLSEKFWSIVHTTTEFKIIFRLVLLSSRPLIHNNKLLNREHRRHRVFEKINLIEQLKNGKIWKTKEGFYDLFTLFTEEKGYENIIAEIALHNFDLVITSSEEFWKVYGKVRDKRLLAEYFFRKLEKKNDKSLINAKDFIEMYRISEKGERELLLEYYKNNAVHVSCVKHFKELVDMLQLENEFLDSRALVDNLFENLSEVIEQMSKDEFIYLFNFPDLSSGDRLSLISNLSANLRETYSKIVKNDEDAAQIEKTISDFDGKENKEQEMIKSQNEGNLDGLHSKIVESIKSEEEKKKKDKEKVLEEEESDDEDEDYYLDEDFDENDFYDLISEEEVEEEEEEG